MTHGMLHTGYYPRYAWLRMVVVAYLLLAAAASVYLASSYVADSVVPAMEETQSGPSHHLEVGFPWAALYFLAFANLGLVLLVVVASAADWLITQVRTLRETARRAALARAWLARGQAPGPRAASG